MKLTLLQVRDSDVQTVVSQTFSVLWKFVVFKQKNSRFFEFEFRFQMIRTYCLREQCWRCLYFRGISCNVSCKGLMMEIVWTQTKADLVIDGAGMSANRRAELVSQKTAKFRSSDKQQGRQNFCFYSLSRS